MSSAMFCRTLACSLWGDPSSFLAGEQFLIDTSSSSCRNAELFPCEESTQIIRRARMIENTLLRVFPPDKDVEGLQSMCWWKIPQKSPGLRLQNKRSLKQFAHCSKIKRHPQHYLDEGPHGEEVGQHGGQALGQAALSDEPCLQLCQADSIIALLPVPAWNVQQMGLRHGNRERRPQNEENAPKASRRTTGFSEIICFFTVD